MCYNRNEVANVQNCLLYVIPIYAIIIMSGYNRYNYRYLMSRSIYNVRADDVEILGTIDLAAAIGRLSSRQQVIIALRASGYTQQSITDLLGVSRTTVWSDEKEAIRRLAELLSPETIEGSGRNHHV